MRRIAAAILPFCALPLAAQSSSTTSTTSGWFFKQRVELRGEYRDSHEQKFELKAAGFPPDFLPVGQRNAFLETVNVGRHAEMSRGGNRHDAAGI